MDIKIESESEASETEHLCLSRRSFLLAGGGAVVLSTLPGMASAVKLVAKEYPRVKIASLKDLKTDQPIDFSYPPSHGRPPERHL